MALQKENRTYCRSCLPSLSWYLLWNCNVRVMQTIPSLLPKIIWLVWDQKLEARPDRCGHCRTQDTSFVSKIQIMQHEWCDNFLLLPRAGHNLKLFIHYSIVCCVLVVCRYVYCMNEFDLRHSAVPQIKKGKSLVGEIRSYELVSGRGPN